MRFKLFSHVLGQTIPEHRGLICLTQTRIFNILIHFSVFLHVFVELNNLLREVLVHRAGVFHVLFVELIPQRQIIIINPILHTRNDILLIHSQTQSVLIGAQVSQFVNHVEKILEVGGCLLQLNIRKWPILPV